MKKTYTKPLLAVEHYELTQTIATCTTKIGLLSNTCVANDPDSTPQMKNFAKIGWFTDSTNCPNGYPEGMDGADKICYHTNINAAFNS